LGLISNLSAAPSAFYIPAIFPYMHQFSTVSLSAPPESNHIMQLCLFSTSMCTACWSHWINYPVQLCELSIFSSAK